MERKPASSGTIIGWMLLVLVMLMGLYVGSYFTLGNYNFYPKTTDPFGSPCDVCIRSYPYDWLASGYRPLMHLEAAVTGKQVRAIGPVTTYSSTGEAWHHVESS